jgi:aldose 1-epimerase
MSITKEKFGKTKSGTDVDIYTITNELGSALKLITYGATIQSMITKDVDGNPVDVLLGFETIEEYETNGGSHGATIGRFANRINHGEFTLNSKTYNIPLRNDVYALHGGDEGFGDKVWDAEVDGDSVKMTYFSEDGEEGFPGNLTTTVKFSLTDENELIIDYAATTDADTVLNLTNHSYFNLNGSGNAMDHILKINSDKIAEVDSNAIPYGNYLDVAGTPMDFNTPTVISEKVDNEFIQIKNCGGYDHSYHLADDDSLKDIGYLFSDKTKIKMSMKTTEVAVQFYAGNFIGDLKGKNGVQYFNNSGLCFETQHHPDSPNKPEFPTTVLKAGETFTSSTIYKFEIEK